MARVWFQGGREDDWESRRSIVLKSVKNGSMSSRDESRGGMRMDTWNQNRDIHVYYGHYPHDTSLIA